MVTPSHTEQWVQPVKDKTLVESLRIRKCQEEWEV